MKEIPLHFLPILVAGLARMVIGAAWYSPPAFGAAFQRLTGCSEAEMKARLPVAILSDFAGSLVMSFILVHAIYYAGATTAIEGMAVGLLNWLGFIAVSHLALVTWGKAPIRLFAINMGCAALSLAAMGAILSAWR